jgi:hypothetical protein
MHTFQIFTDRIIAALRQNNETSRILMQDNKLQEIYDQLPCFHTEGEKTSFRKWIKDATLKHPQRRTAKQYQWLFIVDLQEASPTGYIVLMVKRAAHCLSTWEERALAVDNLLMDDPDDREYFFRNKHAVQDAVGEQSDVGESCWICANDFDKHVHRPQQGPCGHVYCRECFEKTLTHALKPPKAKYTCAFCRSCLVCGASSCEDHVTYERARPFPLDVILIERHLLCNPDQNYCAASEPLGGLSAKRYWFLRERSRELRIDLAIQLYILRRATDSRHEARAKEEVDESMSKVKSMAIQARVQTLEDLEMERQRETWGGDPLG